MGTIGGLGDIGGHDYSTPEFASDALESHVQTIAQNILNDYESLFTSAETSIKNTHKFTSIIQDTLTKEKVLFLKTIAPAQLQRPIEEQAVNTSASSQYGLRVASLTQDFAGRVQQQHLSSKAQKSIDKELTNLFKSELSKIEKNLSIPKKKKGEFSLRRAVDQLSPSDFKALKQSLSLMRRARNRTLNQDKLNKVDKDHLLNKLSAVTNSRDGEETSSIGLEIRTALDKPELSKKQLLELQSKFESIKDRLNSDSAKIIGGRIASELKKVEG